MSPLKAKSWDKTRKKNLEKEADKAENTEKISETVHRTSSSSEPQKREKKGKNISPQSATQKEKKKLPKIIIVTYGKEGNAEHKEYVCSELSVFENNRTDLSGALPTKRKDSIVISIDAQVVEVN